MTQQNPVADQSEATGDDVQAVQRLRDAHRQIVGELEKVIVGQVDVIDELMIAIFARGHCLLVGVPGLAKTLLVSTLARCLSLSFKRVQFTPDLMPSDITGTEILADDPETGERKFKFLRGPVFANIVLADEINRTPPKTQAALLEAMQEKKVSAGGESFALEEPFFVLATQNPIEQEGTYPLPEAQLDRFLFNIIVDYPDRGEEIAMMKRISAGVEAELAAVMGREEILALQQIVQRIPVADHIYEYAATLVRSTRPAEDEAPEFIREWLSYGAGPRASLYLITAGKARAALHGRLHVSIEDVQALAPAIFRHRIILNFAARSEGMTSDSVIQKLLETVPTDEHLYDMQQAKHQLQYLDPEVLQKIGSLELVAREVVEGTRVGAHRSPSKGLSSEFAYHRPYVIGDSPRHLDWRLYARTGRYYMKQYIAETDFTANILLDASSSMQYSSGAVSKLEYAKFLAASLAHLIITQRDMAGLAVFDSELRQYIEPSSRLSIVRDIAVELEKVEGVPRTNIAALLNEFAERIRRRGFVILISDLLDNVDDFMKGLNHLRFYGHNVIVFHTLDPYELTFPFDGTCRFKGLEVVEELVTRPKRVREVYMEELQQYLKKIQDACRHSNVDYVLVDTSRPLDTVLTAFLMARARSI